MKFKEILKKPFALPVISLILAAIMVGSSFLGIFLYNKGLYNPQINGTGNLGTGILTTSTSDSMNSAPNFSEQDGVVYAKASNDANAYVRDKDGNEAWSDRYVFTTKMKMTDFSSSKTAIKRAGILAAYVDQDEFLAFFIDVSNADNRMTLAVDGPRNGGSGEGGWKFEGVGVPSAGFNFFDEMTITVVKDTEDLYILINDIFVYHKAKLYGSDGAAQPGFHNRMTDVEYRATTVTTADADVDAYLEELTSEDGSYFGKHAAVIEGSSSFVYNKDSEVYTAPYAKTVQGGYFYSNRLTPMRADDYVYSADFRFVDSNDGAQMELRLSESNAKRLRFLFMPDGENLMVSTDNSNTGTPTGYLRLGEVAFNENKTVNFKIIHRNGTFSLYVNDEFLYNVQKMMLNPQLGVFYSSTAAQLSNLTYTLDQQEVMDQNLATRPSMAIPFGANTFDATGTADIVTLDEETNRYMLTETAGDAKAAYLYYAGGRGTKSIFSGDALSAEFDLRADEMDADGEALLHFIVKNADNTLQTIGWTVKKTADALSFYRATTARTSDLVATVKGDAASIQLIAYQNIYALVVDGEHADEHEVTVIGKYGVNQAGISVQNATVSIGDMNVVKEERYVRKLSGKARYDETAPNPFGKHHSGALGVDGLFVDLEDTSYEATSVTYAEQYYYEDGVDAIYGKTLMISGLMELNSTQDWSQAIIELVADENNRIRYVLERTNDNKYQLFTDHRVGGNFSGWTAIYAPGKVTNKLEFTLIAKDNRFYFVVNNAVVHYKELTMSSMHVAFGVEKGTSNLSKLHGSVDQTEISEVMDNLDKSAAFKKHAYFTYGVTDAVTYDKANDAYKLFRTKWGDSYHYEKGAIPTAGKNYMISFNIDISRIGGNVELQAVEADNYKIRWFFEKSGTQIHLNTDLRNKGGFSGWKRLKTNVGSKNHIEVLQLNGEFFLVLNGTEVFKTTLGMTRSQFGIGTANADVTLTNLRSSTSKAEVTARYGEITKMIEDKVSPFKGEDGTINGVFNLSGANTYTLTGTSEYRDAYLHNLSALSSRVDTETMLFTSRVALTDVEGGYMDYRFLNANGDYLKFKIATADGKLAFSAEKRSGGATAAVEEFATTVDALTAEVKIALKEDKYYLYVNGSNIGAVTVPLGKVQLKAGGALTTATVNALGMNFDATAFEGLIEYNNTKPAYPFGKNKYDNAGLANAFVDNEDMSYTLTTTGYKESFLYDQAGEAVAGDRVMYDGYVHYQQGTTGAFKQGVMLLQSTIEGKTYRIRLVFEWTSAGKMILFVDHSTGGALIGWKQVYSSISGEKHISIVHDAPAGKVYFFLDGSNAYVTTITKGTNFGANIPVDKPMHLGFGAENGSFKLRNFTATTDSTLIDAKLAKLSDYKPLVQ